MGKIVKKDGFDFSFNEGTCESCGGRCCIGESGYIWVSPNERKRMIEFLDIKEDEFFKKYIRQIKYRYSLKEKSFQNGYACIFFDENKLQCGIYEARPNQCRSFPFWDYFKCNKDELEKECPGVLM